jgi:predicted peroxiredoxin
MAWVATAIVGSTIVNGVVQSNAARSAAKVQGAAADAGIAEQQRQFDAVQELMKPYVQAGTSSLADQMSLLGMSGDEEQQAAIDKISGGAEFAALTQQGENAILQNASATGGLRGGNMQAALAQYRPQVLSALIGQQYDRLGGITSVGQNAAALQGNAGMATGANISNLYADKGAAIAGGKLGVANAWGNVLSDAGGMAGRGMAYQGYQPKGYSQPMTFGQGMFYGGI